MTMVFLMARSGADVVSTKNDVINKPKTNTIPNNKNHINLAHFSTISPHPSQNTSIRHLRLRV